MLDFALSVAGGAVLVDAMLDGAKIMGSERACVIPLCNRQATDNRRCELHQPLTTALDNLQPMCRMCNSSKADSDKCKIHATDPTSPSKAI